MFCKWVYLIGFAFVSACNSAFVDTLQKCSYKDNKCVVDLIQNILKDISKDGVPELDIPPVDPLYLKNISVSIMNLFKFSLDHAQLKGIKDCVINSIDNNFDKGVTNMDITCDLSIKAKYKLDEINPMIQNFLGSNAIYADGNAKVNLEKINMKMNFFYHITKKDDGDLYVECHMDEFRYNFEIGNLKINVNKIFFGNQDVSDFVTAFVNQNWKFIMPTIGQDIFDVAMKIFDEILHRFFKAVPVKYFLTDDVTQFVKN
ncbi:unnamed protein product [Euphydryas editha]|uniref:Juvenile hormone binding protein n=1 Tax=Euphydryas editha TaxID=104508 RepID=A0AAU9TH39_EUPED|nr:unnamed protein product [Euphydryas editha]